MVSGSEPPESPKGTVGIASTLQPMLRSYCLDCHSSSSPAAGLDLVAIELDQQTDLFEKIARRLRARQMPPSDAERPSEEEYVATLDALEVALDQAAAERPMPGRTDSLRRMTRVEYQNAIRDLLDLEIDVATLLPADEISQGFDNITVSDLSPTLLNRYLSSAQKISQLALGRPLRSSGGVTVRLPPDRTQEEHVAGLPLGTRGGTVVPYTFPRSGDYEIRVRLTRDRNEEVEGLREPHQLELLMDSQPLESFLVLPPGSDQGRITHENADQNLVLRLRVDAGPHCVGVAFVKNPSTLLETKRQPLHVHYNMYRHPRLGPAVYQVSIDGPLGPSQSGDTPSRRRILGPASNENQIDGIDADSEERAQRILTRLLRRACRMTVVPSDVERPLSLYRKARQEGKSFDEGIERALASFLVHPRFLFRIERQPEGLKPGTAYRISDHELASRMSYFLWSSIPDETLLDLADLGRLSDPEVLEQQTRRMLADPRAYSLVSNFAGQWLYLRNLEAITPDMRLYPDFDDNLRSAMREETERFLANMLQEDRSVMDLFDADYTYLNERLAQHYGIPHVYGSRFRRVELDAASHRGGLLRHASVLTVTSYATRTSPVLRGKWILENILGTPPPPPPPDIPALVETTVSAKLPVRARLAQHRAEATCAVCHNVIDPVGFAFENFDAIGRWRDNEEEVPVDAKGGLPDGTECQGIEGLERGLRARPDLFARTVAEKLLTYALGRLIDSKDGPAVRKIVRDASEEEYRWTSLVLGIVRSVPFQMRMSK